MNEEETDERAAPATVVSTPRKPDGQDKKNEPSKDLPQTKPIDELKANAEKLRAQLTEKQKELHDVFSLINSIVVNVDILTEESMTPLLSDAKLLQEQIKERMKQYDKLKGAKELTAHNLSLEKLVGRTQGITKLLLNSRDELEKAQQQQIAKKLADEQKRAEILKQDNLRKMHQHMMEVNKKFFNIHFFLSEMGVTPKALFVKNTEWENFVQLIYQFKSTAYQTENDMEYLQILRNLKDAYTHDTDYILGGMKLCNMKDPIFKGMNLEDDANGIELVDDEERKLATAFARILTTLCQETTSTTQLWKETRQDVQALVHHESYREVVYFETSVAKVLSDLNSVSGHEITKSALTSIQKTLQKLKRCVEEYDMQDIGEQIKKVKEFTNIFSYGDKILHFPGIAKLLEANTIKEKELHIQKRDFLWRSIQLVENDKSMDPTIVLNLRREHEIEQQIVQALETQLLAYQTNFKTAITQWQQTFCNNLSQSLTGMEVFLRAQHKRSLLPAAAARSTAPETGEQKKKKK